MRIGIFGGTFNPIHLGHLRAAEEVLEAMGLDRIVFMPSGSPPLKNEELADAGHRLAMTRLAVGNDPRFDVTDLEMGQGGKSYTVFTLEALLRRYPGDELFFIAGLDAFLDLPNWREPGRIVSMIDLIIVLRPGYEPEAIASSPFLEGQCSAGSSGSVNACRLKGGRTAYVVAIQGLDISSTTVRRLVKERKEIRGLVSDPVAEYMSCNRLYQGD